MKTNTSKAKFMTISHQVSPASVLGVSVGYYQRNLVTELLKIITQMGIRNGRSA
jgi:hypothetical protein